MHKVYVTDTPNDLFLIAGLALGGVKGPAFDFSFHDLTELSRIALTQEVDIIKVSCQILPDLLDSYDLLKVGATIVDSSGPKVLARRPIKLKEISDLSLAIPGVHTTAYSLCNSFLGEFGSVIEMPHDQIQNAVRNGEVDCGLVIHEGALTEDGLIVAFDLFKLWSEKYKLPLPLGVWVHRKSLAASSVAAIEKALQASFDYGMANPEQAISFIKQHSNVTDSKVIKAGLKAWVNNETRDISPLGFKAIERFSAQQIAFVSKKLSI